MVSQISLDRTQALSDIIPFAEQAVVRLSFWGARYVYLPLRNETLPIDAIAARVIALIRQNPHFDESVRAHGRQIVPLIDRIYAASDEQLEQCNFFTRLLAFLRNLPNFLAFLEGQNACTSSMTLWAWRDCGQWDGFCFGRVFEYYTREQYQQNFHHFPEEAQACGYTLRQYGSRPPRWGTPQAIAQS